jgi:hypothetical protein
VRHPDGRSGPAAFTDTEARTAQHAGRTVARCGWGILLAVSAVLALHGVGQYILVATTPGARATGILLAGVGLMALMAALDGLRHGSRWAWNITWVVVAVLAALGAHILLGGMRELDGRYLALGAAALAGQILAAADRSPATAEQLSVGRQLRAAYPIGFAYAAGVFGALAYLQLLGFYVVEFGLPQSGGPLGSANDLTGASSGAVIVLGIGFMLGGLVWLAVPLWFFLVGARLATAGLPTQAAPDEVS